MEEEKCEYISQDMVNCTNLAIAEIKLRKESIDFCEKHVKAFVNKWLEERRKSHDLIMFHVKPIRKKMVLANKI